MMSAYSQIAGRQGRSWMRRAIRGLQVGLLFVVLWLAVESIRGQWTQVRAQLVQLRPSWPWIGISGLIFIATYAVLVETWRRMLLAWQSALPFWVAARIWAISNLGRYIPGKVWQIGAMGVMAQRAGVSAIAATGSAILNTIVNIVAGFALVAALGWELLDQQSGGTRVAALLFVIAAVAILALLPRVLPWLIRALSRITGREITLGRLPARVILIAAIGNLIAWTLYGVAFATFARAILGQIHGTVAAYATVYALSYLVGYLVLLVPAGVGVREASMVTLLVAARLADPGQATVLAVTSRLWLTILEVVPGALFVGVDALRRPITSKAGHE